MEIKMKRILDLQKNDRISGNENTYQVISNNKGLLYLYNENTGIFSEKNYRRILGQDKDAMVFIK